MSASRRHVCYVSGTRADFGLMSAALLKIHARPELQLSVVATGTHLSQAHGYTLKEITAAGLTVTACIEVDSSSASGASMAKNISVILSGLVDAFERMRPDLVLLLGDRGEMLAGALAAIHLNIPVVHIHGGERSGTVDEPVRHAISKLSHLHFVSTDEAKDRLVRMGENASSIHVTGAPGLDGLTQLAARPREELCNEVAFDASGKIVLFIFHPVLQESQAMADSVRILMEAILDTGAQVMALTPNSDAGSNAITEELMRYSEHDRVRIVHHLARPTFVSWMAACDVMVGNSSSGIIEAASFGTRVVNIGRRQNLRQRNSNVIDAEPVTAASAISSALQNGRQKPQNCYGDGSAGERIAELLATIPLPPNLLMKFNLY
jgi:GDP/UDP-N,N'-diacetylbacillosamine 2-epimerase (hydrolysing)